MNSMKNPVLPENCFVPDVEARVWEDGRLYLYGSMDIQNQMDYCSHVYHVFSSDDGAAWKDHGIVFSSKDVPWSEAPLYAPDCVYKDGTYYLYFCTADGTIGVGESKNPYGPFRNAVKIECVTGIDPSVLVDGNEAYLYWGQFDQVRGAKLKKNMKEIEIDTVMQPLYNERDGFHEASSVRKINEIYYYVYAYEGRNKIPSCLAYATSTSPMGPFCYQGIIIDNAGCDPSNWNNHGSLCKWKGDWYIFYHRASRNSKFNRRVCAEKITIDKEGKIAEVAMSSSGMAENLSVKESISFSAVCFMQGCCWLEDNENDQDREAEQLHCIGNSIAMFRNLYMEGETKLFLKMRSTACKSEIKITAEQGEISELLFSGEGSKSMVIQLKKGLFGRYHIKFYVTCLKEGESTDLLSFKFYK